MITLLVDNYDSFTYNLYQLLASVNGREPLVVKNDEVPWSELKDWAYDNVVISPGPGHPDRLADFGVCAEVLRETQVPLLGVCLGHQGLASLEGGDVVHAPDVMHGRTSAIYHDGSELFAGIPQGFSAVRYHSLCVARPIPESLECIAWTTDGVVMGLRHRTRPLLGVQFHPESICTSHGRRLLENFHALTMGWNGGLRPGRHVARTRRRPRAAEERPPLEPAVRTLDREVDAEAAFVELAAGAENAFWLDSSRRDDERGRFSFLGVADSVVTYDAASRRVRVERGGETNLHSETIFEYLEHSLAATPWSNDLPFDFEGGFVGYFGYGVKADGGATLVHRSELPDAAFLFADRLVAVDHHEQRTYLVCLAERGAADRAAAWLERTSSRLGRVPDDRGPSDLMPPLGPRNLAFEAQRGYEHYLDDIARCKQYLRDGETYEVCLTNTLTTAVDADPLDVYRVLRRVNPAPYAAFLRFGPLAILSSSPEQFLRVTPNGLVRAKPIKGTAPRGRDEVEDAALRETLRASEKDRAENLMIVDLLRNDLGRVCEIGSVEVPTLMDVETFETVHQLVSTITGRLGAGSSALDCVRACFPGGSMTGAPKTRTMQILDELEGGARGIYSGALGYLGLGGALDLSIVIRTIVMHGRTASIGAGGAIVIQSDPVAEYDEMLLKARPLMDALARSVGGYAKADDDRGLTPSSEPPRDDTRFVRI